MLNNEVQKLVNYIIFKQSEFNPITQKTPYYHMGATITDAILQAGMNYKSVVYPRVEKLLTNYSDYRSTCDFIILFKTEPLKKIINWANDEKLKRIENLTWFLFERGINNEDELSLWLTEEENVTNLRKIKGIGPKTIDYLKMLSGTQAIPIDRHLFKFLELAGIFTSKYEYANKLYSNAAEALKLRKTELDSKIWSYMTSI